MRDAAKSAQGGQPCAAAHRPHHPTALPEPRRGSPTPSGEQCAHRAPRREAPLRRARGGGGEDEAEASQGEQGEARQGGGTAPARGEYAPGVRTHARPITRSSRLPRARARGGERAPRRSRLSVSSSIQRGRGPSKSVAELQDDPKAARQESAEAVRPPSSPRGDALAAKDEAMRSSSSRAQLEERTCELRTAEGSIAEMEAERANSEFARARAEEAEEEARREAEQATATGLIELEALQAKLDAAETRADAAESSVRALEDELREQVGGAGPAAVEEELAQLRADLDDARTRAEDASAAQAAAEARLAVGQQHRDALVEQLAQAHTQAEASQQQLDEVRAESSRAESERATGGSRALEHLSSELGKAREEASKGEAASRATPS